MVLPRLYVIVDRGTLEARGAGVRGFAEELRAGGVRLVQYRDKVGDDAQVLAAAREIAEVFAGTGANLILNDRADLAAELGWGVHVGQGDLSAAGIAVVETGESRRRPPAGMNEGGTRMLGVSTHGWEQVRAAEAVGADYVAVGPVFPTRTKADAEAVVGLGGVRAARSMTGRPLVGIGGITLGNCCSVVEAGVDSVAVISGLFVEGRPVQDVARDFLERMR